MSNGFPVKLFRFSFRAVFAGVKRRFFRLHTATLFASPAVVVDAPAFGGLAGQARGPQVAFEEPADDAREIVRTVRLRKFAFQFPEDQPVVAPSGPKGRIVVAPQEISAALSSGHFRRLSNEPYSPLTETLQFCKVVVRYL